MVDIDMHMVDGVAYSLRNPEDGVRPTDLDIIRVCEMAHELNRRASVAEGKAVDAKSLRREADMVRLTAERVRVEFEAKKSAYLEIIADLSAKLKAKPKDDTVHDLRKNIRILSGRIRDEYRVDFARFDDLAKRYFKP